MNPSRAATARILAGRLLFCTTLWMATTGSGLQQRVAPPPAGAALPRLAPTVPVAAAAAARVLAQSSDQLTQTGQVGGTMTSVLQVGDFAYVGQGTRVVTFDLSRADRPRLLSRGPLLPDRVMDLALAGDHVAALLRRQGLVLLDISRPAEPRLMGQSGPWPLGDAALALAVSGDLAVVGSADALLTVDLTDPQRPTRRGELRLGICSDVALVGKRALCANSSAVEVIDVSQPDLPLPLEAIAMNDGVRGIAATDDLIYVGHGSALAVLDLKLPSDSRIVHQEPLGMEAHQLQLDGGRIYAADRGRLSVLDLTQPRAPKLLSTLRLEQPSDGTRETYGLSAQGGRVLMADDMAALQVIDVADPRAPRKVGGFADLRYAQAVALGSTDRAVVEDWAGSAQLQVWDLLNPAAMRLVGASNRSGIGAGTGRIGLGGRLACAARQSQGILLFDIGDPAQPQLLSTLVTPGIARHCLLLGTWALVAGDRSFAVVDISNPSSPRVLGQLDGIFGAEAVDAVGARAYLATSEGLVIVDLSDPSRPRKLAALELADVTRDVAVAGRYAYLAQRDEGMAVVDIADSAQPRLVGEVALRDGECGALVVEGDRAVAAAGATLYLIDISSPEAPRLLHSLPRPSGAAQLAMSRGLIAVAEHAAGVSFFRIGVPPPTTTPPPTRQATPTSSGSPTPRPPLPFRNHLPRVARGR
ncbi:MAG: hypothetical protein IPL60_03685 [Ardenticatenia bacterium]|nr:hypothetical protein [Ardenticatenia bacterium]